MNSNASPVAVTRFSTVLAVVAVPAKLFWTRAPSAAGEATRPRTVWVEPLRFRTEAKAPSPKVTTLVGSSCAPRVLLTELTEPSVTATSARPAPIWKAPPTAGARVGALAEEASDTLPWATMKSPAMAFGPVSTRLPAPTLVRPKSPDTAPP